MKFLLPHRFKKVGVIITPIGFLLWLLVVKGLFYNLFSKSYFNFKSNKSELFNVAIGFTGFILFVFGMICLAFSYEKKEDEMVKQKRLECLQFAAVLQLLIVFIGIGTIIFAKLHSKDFIVGFFTIGLMSFWISFVFRFNYLLHAKFKN